MRIGFLASALAASLAVSAQAAEEAALPKVMLAHQGLMERYCAAVSPEKPDPAIVAEIGRRLPEFAAAWAAGGPALMRATVEVTGRPYQFAETLATLHGCPDLESISTPLLIAAARYVEAAKGDGAGGAIPPRMLGHFTYTLWHEMEHRHVGDILRALPSRTTPLLEKYAAENPVTLNHLHLFAVEQLVHRAMGREEDYHRRGQQYGARGNRPYARAYQIVTAEGAEPFVAELKPR